MRYDRLNMGNCVKKIHRAFQLLKRLVKYGIAALTLLCTAHCGLLAMGCDLLAVHVLLCVFLFILGFCLSQLFDLCWMHKACVAYICTVVLFVVLKRYDIFLILNIDIMLMRLLMCVIGLLIIGLILWRVQEKNCLKSWVR